VHHLNHDLRGLDAFVPVLAADAVKRLLFVFSRQNAEPDWFARSELKLRAAAFNA
jgi:hypothetical protein